MMKIRWTKGYFFWKKPQHLLPNNIITVVTDIGWRPQKRTSLSKAALISPSSFKR